MTRTLPDLQPTPTITLRAAAPSLFADRRSYLSIARPTLLLRYPDGSSSAPLTYDVVIRRPIDGAAIAAYFDRDGVRHVYLRSAIRPPIELRRQHYPHSRDGSHQAVIWELPAGLVEMEEQPEAAAARELGEELGFDVTAEDMQPLGWTFLNPSVIAERLWFFAVQVRPAARRTPTEDGSALERHAAITSLPLLDALEHCRRGHICDAKTELGLQRLLHVGEEVSWHA